MKDTKSQDKKTISRANEIIKILDEFYEDYNNNKYKYYIPIGKVEKFIQTVGSYNYFLSFISAGNSVGKSTAAVNIIAQLIWNSGNIFFDYPLFKEWKFPKRIRIASEPNTIHETIIPYIQEWFPAGRWKGKRGNKRYISIINTDNDWQINIMTYDQDIKEYESATLGFYWLDEPPPKSIFSATVARLRMGGKGMITATPLGNAGWLYDHIYLKSDKVTIDQEVPRLNEKGEKKIGYKYAVIEAGMEDACKIHGIRGFLEHDYIETIKRTIDPDEIPARMYGKFLSRQGLVFKELNINVHVIDRFDINYDDYAVYMALDPHPRTPDAVLWVAVDRDNRLFVVDELFVNVSSADELVELILKKEKDRHYRVVQRLIDPAAYNRDKHTNYTLHDALSEKGLYFMAGSKKREEAIRLIKQFIHYHEINGKIVKEPRLKIFKDNYVLLKEMNNWVWDNWRGRAKEGKNPKEKPVDKDDHLIEDLGRILMANPVFIEPYVKTQQDLYKPTIGDSISKWV